MLNLIRYTFLTALAALFLAAPAVAQDDDSVQNLRAYFLKDGLDLSAYDRVMLDSLGLEDARVRAAAVGSG